MLTTKVTRLKSNLYGCRVFSASRLIVELRVPKCQISDAFADMLRTLDKLGYDNDMAAVSRRRQKGKMVDAKYIWYT